MEKTKFLSYAEVEVVRDLLSWDELAGPFQEREIYPLRSNEHNAKRRTMRRLAQKGVIQKVWVEYPGYWAYVWNVTDLRQHDSAYREKRQDWD